MGEDTGKQALNPSALALENAAKLLTKVGGKNIAEDVLKADIEAGAPVNPDGSLNLVQYAAWLVKGMSRPASS